MRHFYLCAILVAALGCAGDPSDPVPFPRSETGEAIFVQVILEDMRFVSSIDPDLAVPTGEYHLLSCTPQDTGDTEWYVSLDASAQSQVPDVPACDSRKTIYFRRDAQILDGQPEELLFCEATVQEYALDPPPQDPPQEWYDARATNLRGEAVPAGKYLAGKVWGEGEKGRKFLIPLQDRDCWELFNASARYGELSLWTGLIQSTQGVHYTGTGDLLLWQEVEPGRYEICPPTSAPRPGCPQIQ